jgi:hypothetical protein
MRRIIFVVVLFSIVLATVLGSWALTSAAPCENPPMPTVTDKSVKQVPSIAKPAARTQYTDPVFGTCIVRVTDHGADATKEDASHGLKNEYSRVQSFNADETRLVAMSTGGDWYLYNAKTLQPLGKMNFTGKDVRWDAKDANLLYYSPMDTRLMSYNVQSNESKLVHNFTGDFPGKQLTAVWTRYEGSPTVDSRYWGLMAQDKDWKAIAFLVYDKQDDKIVAKREISPTSVDSVSISPRGNYFVAFQIECSENQTADAAHPCGTMVYDKDFKNAKSLGTHVGHGDLAFDTQGREVFVFQDSGTDYLSMVDLETGTVTRLWPIDFSSQPLTIDSIHISGRAFGKPGWALVSTAAGTLNASTWMDGQEFAMELAPNGQIARLAHNHCVIDKKQEHDYWAEPHGSVNRDFTKVLFTSNWGQSGTEGVDMYMIGLPANAITSKIGPIDTASGVLSSSATGIPGFEGVSALAALGVGGSVSLAMRRLRRR